jgi:hypothetical protein
LIFPDTGRFEDVFQHPVKGRIDKPEMAIRKAVVGLLSILPRIA